MKNYWKIIFLIVIILVGLLIYWIRSDYFSFFICDHQVSFENSAAEVRRCYQELGSKRQDISLCNKITKALPYGWDAKESCMTGVAEAKQDPNVCENIKGGDRRDICLLLVSGAKKDPLICGLMKSFQNDCYSQLGNQLNDASLCSKIQHLDTKNTCYFWVAQRTKNPEICGYSTNNVDKNYCLNELKRN